MPDNDTFTLLDDKFVLTLMRIFWKQKNKRTGNIVHDDSDGGVSDVRRDERAETLLTSGIPQLETNLQSRKYAAEQATKR